MNLPELFTELKRQNVFKVAAAYAVVGWVLIQVATRVFPFLQIPNWAVRLVVLMTVFALPIAMIIASALELTPQAIKRTEDADAAQKHSRGGLWIVIVVVAAGLSLGLFFLGRYPAMLGTPRQSEATTVFPEKSIVVQALANTNGGAFQIAVLYAIREETDEMFKWVDIACVPRHSGLTQLAVTAFFIPYVKDQWFVALRQKLNVRLPSASVRP